jgi:hypothetical protein
MASQDQCDLDHDRMRPAVVRVVVRSSRVGKAGHPMVREPHAVRHARSATPPTRHRDHLAGVIGLYPMESAYVRSRSPLSVLVLVDTV